MVADDDLRKLLLRPECPYARDLTRSGDKVIMVDRLIWFSRTRLGEVDDLEQRLAAVVSDIRGQRMQSIDPWSAPRRFRQRPLAGNDVPSQDVYELPASFFDSSDAER